LRKEIITLYFHSSIIYSVFLSAGEPFKGCLGEVRIGSMLLHYFTYEKVYQSANFTPFEFIALKSNDNATHHNNIGCQLCFDADCKNDGYCFDKTNSYVCECPAGYAEDDCSFNIDECVDSKCQNGATCVDGIANYTCVCNSGWQGWLLVSLVLHLTMYQNIKIFHLILNIFIIEIILQN